MSMAALRRRRFVQAAVEEGGGGDPGGSWTEKFNLLRDFNAGTLGASTNGQPDGFDDAGGGTVYDATHVFEGAKAGKCSIAVADSESLGGSGGFGNWGGVVAFPTAAVKGDDVWAEMHLYLPSDFEISTPGNGSLKTMRLRTTTEALGNGGFVDLQMRDDGESGSFRAIKEGYATDWAYFGAPDLMTRDVFHRLSLHLHLDNVRGDDAGTGRLRFWLDGTRLVDTGYLRTLTNATDVMDAFYLFTYWNGNVPRDQSCWVDAIRVAVGSGTPSWAEDLS